MRVRLEHKHAAVPVTGDTDRRDNIRFGSNQCQLQSLVADARSFPFHGRNGRHGKQSCHKQPLTIAHIFQTFALQLLSIAVYPLVIQRGRMVRTK
jgi:hypothetical protein